MSNPPLPPAPSVLDPQATGGLNAWSGFTAQVRYILTQLPLWLAESSFTGCIAEQNEDVEVFYDDGAERRDLHQLKSGNQTPAQIKSYVAEFVARYGGLIRNGKLRWFVIASPWPNEDIRLAFVALSRYRNAHFPDAAERTASLADLRKKLVDGNIVDAAQFDFTLKHVRIESDWDGTHEESNAWDRIAGGLGRVPELARFNVPELIGAAKEMAHQLHDRKRHHWRRDEILVLLTDAIRALRAGPPRASGDVIELCHQTFAAVRAHPSRDNLPARIRDCRGIPVTVDHLHELRDGNWSALTSVVKEMYDPSGRFQTALSKSKDSPVVYYGFPHVPIAVLAGYLFREQADVILVEHDRDSGEFKWIEKPAERVPELVAPPPVESASQGAAVVRVSISAAVKPGLCKPWSSEKVAIELDFALAEPARGVVASDSQLKSYVAKIRRTLDPLVSGNSEISELHLFAAVPVSVAFAIGQLLASSGYPRAYVYNYRSEDKPQYRWAVRLLRNHQDDAVIMIEP